MEGMITVYLVKLVLFGGYALHYIRMCNRYLESAEKLHPIIWVLSAAIMMQFAATVMHFLHLVSYSSNGVGVKALDVVNDVLGSITQVLLQSLLILIALGYTILQSNLGDLDIILPVVFIVVIINVLLVGFSKIKDDASYKFYENEGAIGWFMCFVRVCLWLWFMWAINSSKKEASTKIQNFLNKFALAGTLYFLSYPCLFSFVAFTAAYIRHKLITVGSYCAFALTVRWLEVLFLRRGEFFNVSTLSSSFLPGGGMKIGMMKAE